MVHAGAGATDDARNQGTLVNALLHHFQSLSSTAGELRPGIVHRLDKETSGLIIVAKNDRTHQALSEMFSSRSLRKTYLALVHGEMKQDSGTINAPVSRDLVRRTRMTTRRSDSGRTAISHYKVLRRLNTRYGRFTLVSVRIETGRTHQIRVHMASIGHPVVGDQAVWRASADSACECSECSQEARCRGYRRRAFFRPEFSSCGGAGVCASSDGEGIGVEVGASRGVDGLHGLAGKGGVGSTASGKRRVDIGASR